MDKIKNLLESEIGIFFLSPTKMINKSNVEQFRLKHIEIKNDIFSLAFAAFIEPDSQPDEEGYLGKLELNSNEIADLFMGGVMVILI